MCVVWLQRVQITKKAEGSTLDGRPSTYDVLKRALEEGVGKLKLAELDALTQLLANRRSTIEVQERSTNMELLLQFLQHSRAEKARQFQELQGELACFEADIQAITAAVSGGPPDQARAVQPQQQRQQQARQPQEDAVSSSQQPAAQRGEGEGHAMEEDAVAARHHVPSAQAAQWRGAAGTAGPSHTPEQQEAASTALPSHLQQPMRAPKEGQMSGVSPAPPTSSESGNAGRGESHPLLRWVAGWVACMCRAALRCAH
jgi:hypothetical protein